MSGVPDVKAKRPFSALKYLKETLKIKGGIVSQQLTSLSTYFNQT